MSEDEGGEDDGPEIKFDEEKAASARKARAEREEKLRKMMEDDDGKYACTCLATASDSVQTKTCQTLHHRRMLRLQTHL